MNWSVVEHDQQGNAFVSMNEAQQAITNAEAMARAAATPNFFWSLFILPDWVMPALLGLGLLAWVLFLLVLLAMWLRIVVSTNEVHIVQSAKRTVSYGKDQPAGNTYYQWPPWIPRLGVQVIVLPVSVFNVELNNYAAYDKGRVPFQIDIMAFFRIDNSNEAAQRVHSFDELKGQLKGILQGAIRSILASSEIEEILEGRSKFGELFTVAVDAQLKAWGVTNVKNVELMDIRDAEDSAVIANIMAKKKSLIEKESRIEVAGNLRAANVAEIEADQAVRVRQQEAEQQVGQRTAEKEKLVGIAQQKAQQEIKEEEKLTAEKSMAVAQVMRVRGAEIEKAAQIVLAEQGKQQTIITASGNLEQSKLQAQGVEIQGKAEGEAKKAVLLAPVNAQITLAEKIAALPEYQKYLLGIRDLERAQIVGVAQAEALKAANIKVIANSGDVTGGVTNVMELLSAKGGTQLGGMVEAFIQTPTGKALIETLAPGVK